MRPATTLVLPLLLLIPLQVRAQSLEEAAWTLPNLLRKVPPLQHDNAGRFPMICIEPFLLTADDRSWQDAKPLPAAMIRELKKRGLTQWIPPDERYIQVALALQKEKAGVIMMQGMAFNGPPDEVPSSMHLLPEGYKGLKRPGQQPKFPCPLVLDGWVKTAEKLRATFRKYREAGVHIDAVWLDWEIEPMAGDAQLDEAKHCSRCRQQFPPGILDDKERYRAFISRCRLQLFSVYFVAPILEHYPGCSVTNWEEVISTADDPTPNWAGTRKIPPLDLGMFTAANPVAYGNTIWYDYHWREERGWPLDAAHMDRIYTQVMLGELSVHERNAMRVAPHLQSIPWVDRFCADNRDPKIPILTRPRYREILRHLWLRGADGMQIFNPLWFKEDAVRLAIATEEIEDAVAIYDELLGYRKFLDDGRVMNTDTPTAEFEGVIWSGLRTGDKAVVRAFTQADKPQNFSCKPFDEADEIELDAPPSGKWHLLERDGKTVKITK